MIRRTTFVLLSLLIPLLLLANVWAQDDKPDVPPQPGIPLISHPPQMLSVDPVVTLQTEDGEEIVAVTAVDASDSCQGATTLTVPGGDETIVNSFTTEEADPPLACAWGTPSNSQGYRTAWYRFTAATHGIITINTLSSSYDTVLSVFDATNNVCPSPITNPENIKLVACSDDYNGFSSRVQFTAHKGRTYFIQVADWQLGVSGNAKLNLSIQKTFLDSSWEAMGSNTLATRSRHATAVIGSDIYVIGGQTIDFDPFGSNSPTLTNSFDKYNTLTRKWTHIGIMPGANGYSNTTAAYVNTSSGNCNQGCIFIPGGYTGGNPFDGKHWAFDFGSNLWTTKASIGDSGNPGWPDGVPFAWSTAVTKPDHTGYYLLGGLSSQPAITDTLATVHNQVYFYRVADNKWIQQATPMDYGRYAHTAAYVGNEICVIGGIEAGGILTPNGQCWNPNGTTGWRNIAALNEARYGAGSSVGPDGKWYVYGGANGSSQAVSTVEVWDPNNESAGWVTLDVTKDLGVTDSLPPRVWPRGGFIGNYLWAIGGNHTLTTNSQAPIPEVQRLFVGQFNLHLPLVAKPGSNGNDILDLADPIALNTTYSSNFDNILDYYDIYTFNLTGTSVISVKLRDIPNNSNYNVYIYDDNKQLWGLGENPSNLNETVNLTLAAGKYYVVVKRAEPANGLPNTKNYRLSVEK